MKSQIEIPILYEDNFLVAINKPAGLPSQPTVDRNRPDIFSLLKIQQKSDSIFLHHRLDKDTSGVLLFSKSKQANGPLTEMFRRHQFKKIYWALTTPLQQAVFEKSKLIHRQNQNGHSSWTVSNHLIARRSSIPGKGKGSVKMFRTESGGDFAETAFEVLIAEPPAWLIEATPKTGRTHQIRVHCLQSGCSILGDTMYGGKDSQVPRLMLHAKKLEFEHPLTGQMLKIEASLPQDFTSLLDKWKFKI